MVKKKAAKKKAFKPISLTGIKTYSIKKRKSKVSVDDFASLPKKGGTVAELLDSMPRILAAESLRAVANAVVKAHKAGQTVSLGMGAHVIKVGLAPLIIDLMERGIIDSVAMNGACVVHDFEAAYVGCTSEDVDSEIGGGTFGMAEETGKLLNRAIKKDPEKGLGRSVGEMILKSRFEYKHLSLLGAAARCEVPATVHVALGTDILHIHPQMDAAATGVASMEDFKLFASVVSTLDKGVYINLGSAVLMPEIFLKALTLVRNKGFKVAGLTTVNMDFIQHYRPATNVVRRPTQGSGKGYALTGHHEIMFPLLYAAIIEQL